MNWFRDRIRNLRLRSSEPRPNLEEEIQITAYSLWERDGKPEGKSADDYGEKASQIVKYNRLPTIYKPYYLLETKILEPGLSWIDKQAFFDILGRLGNLAIVIGVITFISTEDSRRNADVFSAWQTITSAEGQSGSGGRIEALEFLNYQPLRTLFIGWSSKEWYWDNFSHQCQQKWLFGNRFPRQSLSGLSSPKAYLNQIKLCGADLREANLQGAYLIEANLQGAYLEKADLSWTNLQKAHLEKANLSFTKLKNAYLREANLQKANLINADLQEANLKGSILQGAIYTDSNSEPSLCFEKKDCSTIFPDGFDPKQAGMILIRNWGDYKQWEKLIK